jgi:hypothetical protein
MVTKLDVARAIKASQRDYLLWEVRVNPHYTLRMFRHYEGGCSLEVRGSIRIQSGELFIFNDEIVELTDEQTHPRYFTEPSLTLKRNATGEEFTMEAKYFRVYLLGAPFGPA